MPVNKLLIILALVGIGVIVWNQKQATPKHEVIQSETIKIISSDPEPLEEATILPNQTLTINFNKAFDTSRLKIRVEPEILIEIGLLQANIPSDTLTISFKETLQLGSGYTLFIVPDPTDREKLPLEKEYIYHFKTIGYRGV